MKIQHLILMAATALWTVNAWAIDCLDGVERCGTTEDGLTWSISNIKDENGDNVVLPNGEIAQELKIEGTGDMQSYTRKGEGIAPWKNPDHPGAGHNSAPSIAKVTIGEGITSIGGRAFEDMEYVTSVSLPEGLKKIGKEAFLSCGFSQIELPESLETIGMYAFYATQLSDVKLPENLQKIDYYAFGYILPLSDVIIPDNVNIAQRAFTTEGGSVTYIQNVYCSEVNSSCQALKNEAVMADKVQFYKSDGSGYFSGNRWYQNLQDIGTPNHIKKRIYTIDEAETVLKSIGKDHVSFRIRYK